MRRKIEDIISYDFLAFCEKAFLVLEGKPLITHPYVEYVCQRIGQLAPGARHVLNMPPRHCKSLIGSICLPAWTLGRNPKAKVMLIAGSEDLAEENSSKVRDLLASPFFRRAFPNTRLSKRKSRKTDFATDAGGELYATSINGNFTGRGADLLIADDLVDIRDACNLEKLEYVNEMFDSLVTSRLNNPLTAIVLVIMHRLNDNDLSGHLRAQGDWERTVLPLIARRTVKYDMAYKSWVREKGNVSRPDAYTRKILKRLKTHTRVPDFGLLYQQNPLGESFRRIKRRHFGTFDAAPDMPVVLSVDPSLVGTAGSSYNVIQAWCRDGENYLLLDQWREQCTYRRLRHRCIRMAAKYRPAAILVERAGNGAALISDLGGRPRRKIIEIIPRESKVERFRRISKLIRSGKVKLPEDAAWLEDFLDELTHFPFAPSDDQADAATQALAWLSENPVLDNPPAMIPVMHSSHPKLEIPGAVLSFGRSAATGAYSGPRQPNGPFIQPVVWVRF